jgi:hypothetical protein
VSELGGAAHWGRAATAVVSGGSGGAPAMAVDRR